MSFGGGHSKEQGENICNQRQAATNPAATNPPATNPAMHRKSSEVARRGRPQSLWASSRLVSHEGITL